MSVNEELLAAMLNLVPEGQREQIQEELNDLKRGDLTYTAREAVEKFLEQFDEDDPRDELLIHSIASIISRFYGGLIQLINANKEKGQSFHTSLEVSKLLKVVLMQLIENLMEAEHQIKEEVQENE